MEQDIFHRLWAFIKLAYTTYIRQTLAGAGLVGFTVYPLFFNPIPHELVATWIGVWAAIKTIISAYLGSMATALGTHHVELLKKKKNEKKSSKKRQNGKAA